MASKLDELSSSLDAVAIQAGDVAAVPHLITDMLPYLNLPIDEYRRLHLLRIARLLVQALETPRETVIRLCWAEVRFALSGTIFLANNLAYPIRCDPYCYRLWDFLLHEPDPERARTG